MELSEAEAAAAPREPSPPAVALRRAASVRTLTNAFAVTFGVLALAVAAALVWTSSLSGRAMDRVVRDTASTNILDEVELALSTYQRLSNLFVVSQDPAVDAARAELERDVRLGLERARGHVGSAREQRALRRARSHVERYLEHRRRLEAADLPIERVLRESYGPLTRAITSIEALAAINEAEVRRAHAQTMRVDRLANAVGAAAAILLLAGLLAVVLAVRRHVVSPLVELQAAIRRHRGGDVTATPAPRGAAEMREVIQAFGEMTNALRTQREMQLAYLGGVAHDLRNPLSALSMASEILREEPSEERRSLAIDRIQRQVARLERMVGDLLESTRVEAGELELEREPLDLRTVCADVVQLYQPTSRAHTIALRAPEAPVHVLADPLRLEQVVGNLVSNAIKYSPRGGPVDVVVHAEPERAIVEVIDQGIGLSAQQKADLFVPFRRGAKHVASGVGLGLSVVRRIVEAHGGTIEVESELGAGSTFRVCLPRRHL